eukprot:jgi/Ulvmu1/12781/UM097_0008.1
MIVFSFILGSVCQTPTSCLGNNTMKHLNGILHPASSFLIFPDNRPPGMMTVGRTVFIQRDLMKLAQAAWLPCGCLIHLTAPHTALSLGRASVSCLAVTSLALESIEDVHACGHTGCAPVQGRGSDSC